MNTYLVLKVLGSRSICVQNTSIYSDVEIRSHNSDFEDEIEALKKSAESAKLDYNNFSYSGRVVTLVKSNNIQEAVNLAEDRFSEILDLKSIEATTSNYSLSPVGLTKNLETGEVIPIQHGGYEPSMAFMMHRGDTQRFDPTNYILSLDTDLSKRYLRSLHWSRNSRYEKNAQIQILFDWFSVEALLKESETDNIGGLMRWFLGFPNGKLELEVSSYIKSSLNSHPKYIIWKKKLPDILDRIRKFRNDSVHSGFRGVDFTRKELELYGQITRFGTSRCQGAVQLALINGVQTVPEFKEYIALIFEENKNLINDVHGNIIFSLDRIIYT
ncbi:MAG: hypothetical protein V3U87_09230 [Methylococcaceae bacterium]